jgi:hypothetical protein
MLDARWQINVARGRWVWLCKLLLPLLCVLITCGCTSPAHWVPANDLRPSADPEIDAMILSMGQHIDFDETLGRYEADSARIIGRPVSGIGLDTFSLQNIRSVRIVAQNDATKTMFVLAAIVLPIAGCVYLLHWIGEGETNGN